MATDTAAAKVRALRNVSDTRKALGADRRFTTEVRQKDKLEAKVLVKRVRNQTSQASAEDTALGPEKVRNRHISTTMKP